jgi:hypothetical protein
MADKRAVTQRAQDGSIASRSWETALRRPLHTSDSVCLCAAAAAAAAPRAPDESVSSASWSICSVV